MAENNEFIRTPTAQGIPFPFRTMSIAERLTRLAQESFMLYARKPILVIRRTGNAITMILGIGTDKEVVQTLTQRGYEIPVTRYAEIDDRGNTVVVTDTIVIRLNELQDPPTVVVLFGEDEIFGGVKVEDMACLNHLAHELGFSFEKYDPIEHAR
jgi:hypothetical protein